MAQNNEPFFSFKLQKINLNVCLGNVYKIEVEW